MNLKLDENLGDPGRSILEEDGHDVSTVVAQNLGGASDTRLFEICSDEGRILITLDHDFAQTLRFAPEKSAGIVVLKIVGRQSAAAISARIKELAMLLRERPLERELWILEPGRVRIHEKRSVKE